jgi:hypothetical protein
MRAVLLIIALTYAAPLAAQTDSAAFVVRLGTDTSAMEVYVRTPTELRALALQRSPVTTLHRLVINFGQGGRVTESDYAVRPAPNGEVTMRRVTRFVGDSAIIETTQGGTTRTQRALARDAIPHAGPFYATYELAIMRALQRNSSDPIKLLPGAATVDIPVQRVGRDSVALVDQFAGAMRAHVDARSQILHLHTPSYTTVERVRMIDIDRYAREFARRDEVGKGMGPLSPRQTYRRRLGEANLWIDYSRPAMRGRPVWGGLVPYGRVWRMGANDAAHLATDRPLQIGDITVQPGTYTLFLLPSADRWELVVNRRTGMSGLDYDPAQDVGRTTFAVERGAAPVESFLIDIVGDDLLVAWDRMRGRVPLRVK